MTKSNVSSIQARLAHIEELQSAIETHPLCLTFYQDANYYYITFPEILNGVGGLRSIKAPSRSAALERLYNKLEKLWNQEMSIFGLEK